MSAPTVPETTARQVLMLRAFESAAPDSPLWTAEDRGWATRLTRTTLEPTATPEQFVIERARHAVERLAPRDARVARALTARVGGTPWLLLAVLGGLLVGLLIDTLGNSQPINLLAPPVWGVIAWSLLIYLLLALRLVFQPMAKSGWLRRLVQSFWTPPRDRSEGGLHAYRLAWVELNAPRAAARAAVMLHVAAAALAAGLIAGMYLRGLVLDYRAGWQSTFLDAPIVHDALQPLLAPATAVTGITIPSVETLAAQRVGPDGKGNADAAPWIHLYAAMLVLFVGAPRLLLALVAAIQAWWLARRWTLPWQDAYFQRLMREHRIGQARILVVPHATALAAQVGLNVRQMLAPTFGDELEISIAATVPYGEEDAMPAASPDAKSAVAARLALFDLGATPEAETHGRLLAQLRADDVPLVVLVDEAAFARRFATMPARIAERRALWQHFAERQQLPWLALDLEHPDATAGVTLRTILGGG
jgi:hypothetical protein